MSFISADKVEFPGLGISIDVDPVAFRIGNFEVYWYGILIAAALLLCIALGLMQAKKHNFPDTLIYDAMLVTIPCCIVGARLYYVFCNWGYYSEDYMRILDTRAGGLAVYGGIIGTFLGLSIMCAIRKIPFTSLMDYGIVYLPLGQAIGRWGNFFNQEAFGINTNLPWGMTSLTVQKYLLNNCPMLLTNEPVHPTFLYESILDLFVFIILLVVRKKSKTSFETTAMYFILYGAGRFFIEGLRTDSLYIGNTGIRTSQALSAFLVFVCLIYIAVAHAKRIERKPFPAKLYEDSKKKAEAEPALAVAGASETADLEASQTVSSAEKTEKNEVNEDAAEAEETDNTEE